MIKKKELPCCPYCGKPIRYIIAWAVQNQGEYRCDGCHRDSNIRFSKPDYLFSWICELAALLITIVFFIFVKEFAMLVLFFVLLPFLFFYVMIPFRMELRAFGWIASEENAAVKRKHKAKKVSGDTIVVGQVKGYQPNRRERINSIETIPIRTAQSKQSTKYQLFDD